MALICMFLTGFEQEHRVIVLRLQFPPLLDGIRHFLALVGAHPFAFAVFEGTRVVIGMIWASSHAVDWILQKAQVIVQVTTGRVDGVFDKRRWFVDGRGCG